MCRLPWEFWFFRILDEQAFRSRLCPYLYYLFYAHWSYNRQPFPVRFMVYTVRARLRSLLTDGYIHQGRNRSQAFNYFSTFGILMTPKFVLWPENASFQHKSQTLADDREMWETGKENLTGSNNDFEWNYADKQGLRNNEQRGKCAVHSHSINRANRKNWPGQFDRQILPISTPLSQVWQDIDSRGE